MKIFRTLMAVAVLLILVLIMAIAAIAMFADPNKLKPYIIRQIESNTTYHARINGELHWSILPKLGVKLDDLELKDAQNAKLDFKNIRISADPRLLLKRNLQAGVYIERLQALNLTIEKITSTVSTADDDVNLHNIKFNFYEGNFSGNLLLSHVSRTPTWNFDGVISHVNLRKLISDLDKKENKLTVAGFVDGNVKLQTVGKAKPQIIQNLSGKVDAQVNDGSVIGFDLNYWLQTADSYFNKGQTEKPVNHEATAFNHLSGLFVIKKGIAETNNLQLQTAQALTTTTGTINLNNEALNLRFVLKSSAGAQRQWEMPATITGTLEDYAVNLDLKDVGRSIMENQFNDPDSKASKLLNKILPQGAQDAFRKMINQ